MAYRFTSLPPPRCVSTPRGFFEAEICRCRPRYVRPTCATQPTCLPAPALVALVLPATRGLRPSRDGSRDTTFHDVVVRFRRTVEARPGIRRGCFVQSSFWHPCRPFVRRHAVLADDREPIVRAETAITRFPREEVEREDDPGVPSFGRTLGLPSAWSIPTRALRRECDPVNVHEAVRPAIASSSRAPWACTLRCGSGGRHPRPEPPPARLLHDARSVATGSRRLLTFIRGQRAFKRASLGLRLPTDICSAYRRAGTPASRESFSARGSRLCPRSGQS